MLRRTALCAVLMTIAAGLCFAQKVESAKPEPRFFRLDLVLKEVEDNHVTNARTYSAVAASGSNSSVRTGSKIPIRNASGELNYIDVGVSIDYRRIVDLGDMLSLELSADVSGPASADPITTETGKATVLRQNRWSSTVFVPFRKPTTVFTSDDVTSKRKLQVELTATPLQP